MVIQYCTLFYISTALSLPEGCQIHSLSSEPTPTPFSAWLAQPPPPPAPNQTEQFFCDKFSVNIHHSDIVIHIYPDENITEELK